MVFNNDTLYPADILRRTIFDFFEINEITEYPLENLGLGDKIMAPNPNPTLYDELSRARILSYVSIKES
jgi:hypothetical protein